MTLCVAWVREVSNTKELIFATDSCLSGGERWHSGVKLFELPRKDCLICFAGDTNRTYPLILNLISSVKFDHHLANTHTDIKEVLEYLTNLFTNLCNSITDYGTQEFEQVLGNFEFLFGGWSWEENDFKLWRLSYNFEMRGFAHDEIGGENMVYAFIGDELETAERKLKDELEKRGRLLTRTFDMEPFKVLLEMIRDKSFTTIDGAIQLAKIYPPGTVEFFGVLWPSADGKKTFLGKDVTYNNMPLVKYIDPDTTEIIGDEVPYQLSDINERIYGENSDFIKDCYPDGKLKEDLRDRDKKLLKSIFKEIAYSQFLEKEKIKFKIRGSGEDI